MSFDSPVKVSVAMATYNHEEFISQALDSVLMQKTNFDYEIIIGEDCSTDNTRNIVIEYQKRYPDKLHLLLHKKNIGPQKNAAQVSRACKGQYIAVLEGDDYWTDPLKLQKQVDFLERNVDYGFCATRFSIVKAADGYKIREPWGREHFNLEEYRYGREVTLENMFSPFLLMPLTLVYKRDKVSFSDFRRYKYAKDIFFLAVMLAKQNAFVLNEDTAVYRISSSGIWSMKSESEKLRANTLTSYDICRYFSFSSDYHNEFAATNIRTYLSQIGRDQWMEYLNFNFKLFNLHTWKILWRGRRKIMKATFKLKAGNCL